MTESGYYPMGAEFDKNAPYNQVEPEPLEIEVTVSVTLSKTMKIKVNDYLEEIEEDEEGIYRITRDGETIYDETILYDDL